MPVTINGSGGITSNDGSAAAPPIAGTDTNTGIFFPAADTIAFAEGGAEVARFDSSGNLGIGTSSPAAKFAVSNGGAAGFEFSPTGGISSGTYIQSYNRSTSAYVANTNYASTHTWYVASTRAMDIDSSGNLLVGTTSGTQHIIQKDVSGNVALEVINSNNSIPYGMNIRFSAAAPNDAFRMFLTMYDTGGTRAQFRANGGLANYQANNANLSDRREKTNFAPAKNYLDTICAIPVQTFNYIDQNMEEDPGETLGVVAQDVQAVAPELVMESNWGTAEEPKMRLSIYQTDLQYALMKCIQELKAELDTAKARIAALEGRPQ